MARITVEDCIKLVNNQYDLVILAKERAVQLGRGATPAVDPENDKKFCAINPGQVAQEVVDGKYVSDQFDRVNDLVDELKFMVEQNSQ